jgi:hypothetical protein
VKLMLLIQDGKLSRIAQCLNFPCKNPSQRAPVSGTKKTKQPYLRIQDVFNFLTSWS